MNNDSKVAMKWWGIAFLIIAFTNFGSILYSYFKGDFKALFVLPTETKTVVAIIFFAIFGIIFFIELFLSIQAFRQFSGKYKGKSHITLAKIFSVVIIILAIVNIIGFINKTVSFANCWISIADVIIIFGYIDCAKKLREINK